MRTTLMKLLTIIAEGLLENRLVADLRARGATGYSVGHVEGRGRSTPPTGRGPTSESRRS